MKATFAEEEWTIEEVVAEKVAKELIDGKSVEVEFGKANDTETVLVAI